MNVMKRNVFSLIKFQVIPENKTQGKLINYLI